jgi:starch synthase (maltosyl-transferring)
MLIYNLFPPLVGTFSQWVPHLARAADMGFNWIFVNPIQHPGFSGSLYSIRDYFSINPRFVDTATDMPAEEQVRTMLREAAGQGLHFMVDLVVNHSAVDSYLIEQHPRWYKWRRDGKVANPFAMDKGKKVVWGDLAKFDHEGSRDREGLYRFFFAVVTYLLSLGFRGFRCDAAYQVPRHFWERLIRETKESYPDARFFAETLGCTPEQTRETALAGFDYIFNSSKWWDLKSPWLLEQYNHTRKTAPSIGFPESHDTLRLAHEFDGNADVLKQRYFFAAFFSAGVMIPVGYEFGFRRKTHVVETRPEDWEQTGTDLTGFITEVNRVKSEHRIFQQETRNEVLHADDPEILLMRKCSGQTKEEALIILNRDSSHERRFCAESLRGFFHKGGAIADVSPGSRLEPLPEPFSVTLKPGQGMVLVAS